MRRIVIVGGGTAGLAAAYTLKKRGLDAIVLEAGNRGGGRLGGDQAEGFLLDEGADSVTPSHDVAIRLCNEFSIPLISTPMGGSLGWHRKGQFTKTTAGPGYVRSLLKNLTTLQALGMVPETPSIQSFMKLAEAIKEHEEYLSFASDSRLAEVDGDESAAAYLARLGVKTELLITIRGLLQMTMARLDQMGAMYVLTYLNQFMMQEELRLPETGMGSLGRALVESCGNALRVSSPVRRVVIENGMATSVILDDGAIEADAVICATTATQARKIMPDLPEGIAGALRKVAYSRGCRVVIGLDYHPLPDGLYGVLYPDEDAPILMDRSVTLPACIPSGKGSLDMLVGGDRAEALFPLDDQEIKCAMLREARQFLPPGARLPGDDEGVFTRVYRWREAVCLAPPGMLKAIATMRREHAGEVKNLFLAGDYMRVPSANGALDSGIDAAGKAAQFLESRSK